MYIGTQCFIPFIFLTFTHTIFLIHKDGEDLTGLDNIVYQNICITIYRIQLGI